MEWTFERLGVDLKELNPKVREKALELANQLKEEGYTDAEAIRQAIKEAEEWYLDTQG